MTVELLNNVLDAEKQADDMVKQALLDAKEIQRKAEKEARQLIDTAVAKEQAAAKETIARGEEEANAQVEKQRAENERICAEIRAKAQSNIDKAVDAVMERIVSMNGNC